MVRSLADRTFQLSVEQLVRAVQVLQSLPCEGHRQRVHCVESSRRIGGQRHARSEVRSGQMRRAYFVLTQSIELSQYLLASRGLVLGCIEDKVRN